MLSYELARSGKTARTLAPGLLLLCALLVPSDGNADGALAVGKVAGFAFGIGTNYDAGEARRQAVQVCRETPDAVKTPALRADCKVIETFTNKCVAVAWDPAPNYPNVGVGWSIAADLETAQRQAIAKCETTVATGRNGTCVVSRSRCDGSAH